MLRSRRPAVPGVPRRRARVSRNVVVLGSVSLLTDVSSEMVAAILPIYLVFALGASPLQFGIVDGIYQGATAVVRLASGFVADRWQRHKEVAAAGYGLSAACKAGLVAIGGSVSAVAGIVLVDRAGKGIRTAPRDALIALSSAPAGLATAFGVHRAMDTAGALLGPLVAFGLLLLAPARFDAIFVVSLCFAVLGLAVLLLLVDGRPRERTAALGSAGAEPSPRPTLREAAALLVEPRFRTLVAAASVLAVATISDGFVYLGLQRTLDLSLTAFPLLFVGAATVYMALAIPVGRLADRIGRRRVFVAGYALLMPVYAALLIPSAGMPVLLLALGALGAYYAATDGVVQAIASAMLPDRLRASGLALLVTATSLAKLVSSLAFGLAWTLGGLEVAAGIFIAALAVALLVATLVLRSSPEAVAP
ncbi:MAG: MFS transporter [Actinomycetota bacterium]|nr:MFS transporter [Actinomycetota bacterium]